MLVLVLRVLSRLDHASRAADASRFTLVSRSGGVVVYTRQVRVRAIWKTGTTRPRARPGPAGEPRLGDLPFSLEVTTSRCVPLPCCLWTDHCHGLFCQVPECWLLRSQEVPGCCHLSKRC